MSAIFRASFFALALALVLSPASDAQSVPTGFTIDSLVTNGLASPTDFCFLPDGRVVIAEYAGGLKLWVPSMGAAVTSVGTISGPNVETGGERGLLSIAADPGFATNGYVYTWSARDSSSSMWLTRHTLTGDLSNSASSNLTLAAASQYIIINDAPDIAFNHNGGTVRFGPDGMLYLSIGDDANACDAQNRTTLSGVLLRLDVSGLPAGGGGPASKALLDPGDNPFSASGNLNERLVVAWGLRNPFSFDVDPTTGDLFIGDVGQNAREELSWFQRNLGGSITGVNFGWPWKEGVANFSSCGGSMPAGLVDPIHDYPQSTGGVSIMAAGLYRNLGGSADWGPAYERNAFHNDYFNGTITRLVFNAGTNTWSPAAPVPGQPSPTYWGSGFQACVHFQIGADGSVYFVDRNDGDLRRIRNNAVPTNMINVVSGAGQVGVRNGTFKHPVVVEIRTPGGVVIPGAQVTFSVTGGSIVGPSTVTADGNGLASAMVQATSSGGVVVTANTPSGPVGGVQIPLFARGLAIIRIPQATTDLMVVTLTNTTNGAAPVPFLFAMTVDSVPTVPTPFGLLGVSILDGNGTFVIEDPFCIINCNVMQGGFGTPGKTSLYSVPVGVLAGTLRFQMIVVDGTVTTSVLGTTDSDIGFTNIVTITF